jgi:hypothetical protein
MKLLTRLWAQTGKPYFFFLTMALSLLVLAETWYEASKHYNLHELSKSPSYHLGMVAALTALIIAMALTAAFGLLLRRYLAKPLPVDPDFPPTKMIYLQGDGEPERCACHGQAIEDGTEIWHWPQPAKLVCAKRGHAK